MFTKSKLGGVLKKKNFFALWIGQVISQFGDRLAQMGLVGIYLSETQSISVSSSVPVMRNLFFFSTLPILIFSPVAGVYVDRWSRRNTLIISDFLRAGLVLFIPFFRLYTKNINYIYLVIFFIFLVTCFFTPAKSAIIPNLVSKDELLAANSLSNITRMLAMIGGVALGGLIVARMGVNMSFIIDSVSFGISGLAVGFIKIKENNIVKNTQIHLFKKISQDLIDGLRFIKKKAEILSVAISLLVLMGAGGLSYVLITVMITKELGLGTIGLGIAASALGLGMIGGSLIYGQFGSKLSKNTVILFGAMMAGVCALLFGRVRTVIYIGMGIFLIGFIAAVIMVAATTLTQEITPDPLRGRIFSSLEVIINSSFLFFVWIAGVLGSRYPISSVFQGIGISLLVYSSLMFILRGIKRGV